MSPRAPQPPRCSLAPEPAVVGAMVTGALLWTDVAVLPADAFATRWCDRTFTLLAAALEHRAEGNAVPGPRHGRGLDLAWVLRLCAVAGVCTWHRVPEDGWRRRTLADVVRDAPRRHDALRALDEVGCAAEDRRTADAARARRAASPEATALRRAYRAWVAGDHPAALVAVVAVERWLVGPVEPREMVEGAEVARCG